MTDDRRPLLPPGTRVRHRTKRWVGAVPGYDMTLACNLGWFPVRWHWGGWETCGTDDVIVVTAAASRFDAA